jgi:hypothetical protein
MEVHEISSEVSIQLIAPTKRDYGNANAIRHELNDLYVSIQLIAPTKRDKNAIAKHTKNSKGFHSINCPYKERPLLLSKSTTLSCSAVSIQLIAPTKRD